MTSNKFLIRSIPELNGLAKSIFVRYPDSRIFAFFGSMGAGKTTFIKELLYVLGVNDYTSSPTFSIINEYSIKNRDIVYHFDFYRVKTLEEVFDLGIEDYFSSNKYCFIEWSENIINILPKDTLHIKINVKEDNVREFIFFKK